MSQALYDRKAVIIFGEKGKAGKRLDGLRVSFEIEKTPEAYVNRAKVAVYNLSRESRADVEKKDIYLVLSAGYGTQLGDLFKGDITRGWTEQSGADFITNFEVGDGQKAYQESNINVTFSEGTSLKDVFTSMAATFGKTIKDLSAIDPGSILNGLTLSGLSRAHMDELTKKAGLEWSIQDDAIQIVKAGGATREEAVFLSQNTGLLRIPKKKEKGIEFDCLLQPKIAPGKRVIIESRTISGIFVAQRVVHKGDNFDKDFMTSVEAIPYV